MTGQLAQAHGHFFKLLIAEPGAAGALLRERLPPEVVGLIGEGDPAPMPGAFVNEHLRELYTDSLFRFRLRGEAPACLYVIVEHKSEQARRVEFQLLNYENAVCRASSRANSPRARPSPRWSSSTAPPRGAGPSALPSA